MLDIDNLKGFVNDGEISEALAAADKARGSLRAKTGAGRDFLGWLDLPVTIPQSLIDEIKDTANKAMSRSDHMINIGIGGSYLGARAAIEFLSGPDAGEKVLFAGQNMSSDYLAALLRKVADKDITLCVISKSGTTTEPALVFRILKEFMERKYSKEEMRDRIICVTDKSRGALKETADKEGYKTFVVPDDVGGRFSVLTPVGLLAIAAAGIDIEHLLAGARRQKELDEGAPVEGDMSARYAAIRNILYKKGKVIEMLSYMHPGLQSVAEWWKQLFGESEGKGGKGIFPASCGFTTDLHSMGQLVQDGMRNIMETFLVVKKPIADIIVPASEEDLDKFNCVSGKSLDYVNEKAYEATAKAHFDGGVPNMAIWLPDRMPLTLGRLLYFFERAVAISGYMLGVNPFDQPGVEAYKKNMFALLGRE